MNAELPIEIVNAIIESARIGFERGFILDSWLSLDYGGTGQGFGGYVLGGFSDHDKCPAAKHDEQPNIAAEWIVSVMRAADVESWSDLKGKCIRVRREAGFGGRILGIGHITRDDRWFLPKDRFAALIVQSKDERDELREILCDLVRMDSEEWAIGGGPNWQERKAKAWARAREVFEP